MLRFQATEIENKKRVDVFLAAQLKDISRSFINQLCDEGRVLINSKVAKPGSKLRVSDVISVDFELHRFEDQAKIKLPIVYEDSDCLVINKPSGILTHSKGSYNPEPTVATFIASKLNGLEGNRGGIVHRLDRGTSGIIICAKNHSSLKWLQKQFSERKVKKTYIAIVSGLLTQKHALIDMPIERHPKIPKLFRAALRGKRAITEYKVIKEHSGKSMLELRPKTGRTHQIRVHLQKIGHPIIGDKFYGGLEADRLFLHAKELEITLPDKTRKVFSAELPKEFKAIMD